MVIETTYPYPAKYSQGLRFLTLRFRQDFSKKILTLNS
jgi:hypothetical protein